MLFNRCHLIISAIIGFLLSPFILLCLAIGTAGLYLFTVPFACFGFGSYTLKRFRYKQLQAMSRRKLRLLNYLVAEKTFAMNHA